MFKKCLTEYNKRVESSSTKKLCDYWKYVKRHRAFNKNPKEIFHNGTVFSNKTEVTNMFSGMFSSVYSTSNIDTDNNLHYKAYRMLGFIKQLTHDFKLGLFKKNSILFTYPSNFRG